MGEPFSEETLLLEIGHLAMTKGLYAEAFEIMEGLVNISPDAPHPRTGRALALFMQGRLLQAAEDLEVTVGIFPDAVFARSLLALFLKKLDDPRAVEVALGALALNPPGFVAKIALEVVNETRGTSGFVQMGESSDLNIPDPRSDEVVERLPFRGFRGHRV